MPRDGIVAAGSAEIENTSRYHTIKPSPFLRCVRAIHKRIDKKDQN
jgi:hypothetical protein